MTFVAGFESVLSRGEPVGEHEKLLALPHQKEIASERLPLRLAQGTGRHRSASVLRHARSRSLESSHRPILTAHNARSRSY